MAIMRATAAAGLVLILAACGGNGTTDSETGDFAAYTVAEVPLVVNGSEAELDLNSADAVLAAALSTANASFAVGSRSLASLDLGGAPPGRGTLACSAGSQNETVAVDAGTGRRTITLTSSQCFGSTVGSNQNGVLQLAYLRPTADQATGTLTFGASPLSSVVSLPELGSGEFNFRQGRGTVVFSGDFDGSPSTSVVNDFSLVIGRGPLSASGTAFTPNRQIEVLLGAGGDFSVGLTASGVTASVVASGLVAVRGSSSGVVPPCISAARFDVATTTALQLGTSGNVTGGLLALSTSAGTATVSFDASGNAVVTPITGTAQTYPAATVGTFCGLF